MFDSFSLLTAFVAGMVALFAPCCIGFLLPSYLGTIFKDRKRVLFLTAIFALGIFTVFLPIGLGIGALGAMLTRFHNTFFYFGSAMLLVFGAALLWGKMPMFHIASPKVRRMNVAGVYVLGIFSGIGSSCCAPVFAGVVAISLLSGSVAGGALLAAVYVFGMVAPLFALSWALDRTRLLERFLFLQRKLPWRLGPLSGDPIFAHVVAGLVFLVSGVVIAWLTATGRIMSAVMWRDPVQTGIPEFVVQSTSWLSIVPNAIWIALFVAGVVALAWAAIRSF